jgi:glutathione S-transferase
MGVEQLMYQLHIANKNYSSWSLRPWVLLRQMAIPFAEQLHQFPADSASRAFFAFSPTGKVPCLHDGSSVVYDSLAIVEYLAERHPGVWPGSDAARAWARCASAEMHSGFEALRGSCSMNCGIRVRLNGISSALQADLDRLEELWSEGLNRFGGPFLAGEHFSAVDAVFAPVAFRVQTYQPPLTETAKAYAQRLLDLPAMRQWYADGLRETWRDQGHEDEVARCGTLTEDLRQS